MATNETEQARLRALLKAEGKTAEVAGARPRERVEVVLSTKAQGALLEEIGAGGVYPAREPAERSEAADALMVAIAEWLNRDEAAETGPTHPSYVLAGIPDDLLLAMLLDLDVSMRDGERGIWWQMLAIRAFMMVRDDLLNRFERLRADLDQALEF